MKKITFIFVFLFSLIAVPMAFGGLLTVCPASLNCNYEQGRCEYTVGFDLDSSQAQESFVGWQNMALSRIWAVDKGFSTHTVYHFECTYQYGQTSHISIYRDDVISLVGVNWKRTGFGYQHAECLDVTNPAECAVVPEIQL